MNNRPLQEVVVGVLDEIGDPGCRDEVYAYQNFCMHAGHPLNWKADAFLTGDRSQIICSSHGAIYEIHSGECVAGPCPGKKLRPVEVRVIDGVVVAKGPTTVS
jgi:nitrite reductase/ring-hydroxylating ferredoxin subunit